MALDVLVGGANVDAGGNIKVALAQSADAYIGPVRMFTENDPGTHTGTPFLMMPETSTDYKLRVGIDTLLFNDSFNMTAQNTGIWKTLFATMTATAGGGSILLNANSSTASGNGVAISTWKHFPLIQTTPTYVEWSGYPTAAPLANQVVEFGLFVPVAGPAVPTEGAIFRYSSAGLYGITIYNGVETAISLGVASLTPGVQKSFIITIGENQVRFWQGSVADGDELLGTIDIPDANGTPFMTYALPLAMQFRNNGLVSGAPHMQWKMCNVSVGLADWATNKPWSHQMTGMGLHSSQGQNGHTSIISTAVAVTGAPAAAAAVVAASAAAQFTGLGGIFRVLPTLTTNTEGLLCNYINPVGSINITPRTLYITGVKLYSMVEVALTGGPLINVYQLLYGASADTLVTAADSASFATATAKCHRRIPLGIEVYAAAAAVGNMPNPNGLSLDLSNAPIAINPGERVAIGLRNQGTVTTFGNLLITVAFTGYWE